MRPGILRYEDKEVHGRLVRVAICAPGEGEAPPKDNFNRKPPSWYGAPPDGQGKTSWGRDSR
jgi:hypothetical protein